MKIVGMVFVLMLFGYTAWRNIHLITSVLPDGMVVGAYFALAAFEGGILYWTFEFLWGSHSQALKGMAAFMVGFDLVASFAGYTLDSILFSAKSGKIPELASWVYYVVLIVLNCTILFNVFLGLVHWISSMSVTGVDEKSGPKPINQPPYPKS